MESENEKEKVLSEEFLIRPCDMYVNEYKECMSMTGRFHQYFVHGVFEDCRPWYNDHLLCKEWKEKKDIKVFEELLENEKNRRIERLQGQYRNTTWKKRSKPPENWNSPLPEWLQEKHKNTYLSKKAKDIEDGTVDDLDVRLYNACTIS